VNVFEPNVALDILWNLALGRFGIDFRSRVKQLDNVRSRATRGCNVRDKCKDISCMDSTEYGRLFKGEITSALTPSQLTMRPMKNSLEVNSRYDTSREPYQNVSEMAKKANDWEIENNKLLQKDVLLDSRRGFSRLLL
jgi:hypothetical protein